MESTSAKTPADFLKSIRGKRVVVKLNSGVDYRGILACLDGYMNIAMEHTEVSAREGENRPNATTGVALFFLSLKKNTLLTFFFFFLNTFDEK